MVRLLKSLTAVLIAALFVADPATVSTFTKHKTFASTVRPSGRIYLRDFQYGAGPRYGYGWLGPKYVKDPAVAKKHRFSFHGAI